MNKKGVIVFLLFAVVLSSILVSADDSGITQAAGQVGGIIQSVYHAGVQPLGEWLFGVNAAADATKFFTLVVLFILLLSLIYEITERVPVLNNSGWMQFVASFVVALISVRFLALAENAQWYQAVLFPTQVLGIALVCLVPLIIYFFFVMDIRAQSPTLAKVLWIFAAVVFAVLYFVRSAPAKTPGLIESGSTTSTAFNPFLIYLFAAIGCVILFAFDGTFARWMTKIQGEKATAHVKRQEVAKIRDQMTIVVQRYQNQGNGYLPSTGGGTGTGRTAYKSDMKYLQDQIDDITAS